MKRFITSSLLLGALFNIAISQPNPIKTIHVTVKNSATDRPVNETEVTYKDFNGTQRKITNSEGRVVFQVKLLTNPMEASIELNDAMSMGYNKKATKVTIELKEAQDVYEVAAVFRSLNKGIMVSVTDASDKSKPVAGAKVTLSQLKDARDQTSNTDDWGNASFEILLSGDSKTVPVVVEKKGYETFKTSVQLDYKNNKNQLNIALKRDENSKLLKVKVISTPDLLPVVGANVVANGKGFHGFATGSTDNEGVATLLIETGGEFLVTVKHGNFNDEQKTVTIKQFGEEKETILPFEVKRKESLKRDLKVYVYEKNNSGDRPVSKTVVFVNGRPGTTGSDGIAEFKKMLFMGEIGNIEIAPSNIYEGVSQSFLGGGDQTRYLPAGQDATLVYLTKKAETNMVVTVRVLDEKTMSPVGGVVTQIRLAESTLTPYDTTYANGERDIKINKKYLANAPLRLFTHLKGYEDKWVDMTADFLNPPQDGKIFTVFIKKIDKEKKRNLKVLVRDSKTLKPVAKATVNVNGNNVLTDERGLAVHSAISTAGEDKTIYVSANGYEQTEKDYKAGSEVGTASSVPVDEVEVLLQKKPARALFTVQVLDNATNRPIPGASAVIKLYNGTAVSDKEKTDIKGEADLEVSEGAPANGQFRLVASADNYEEKWNDIPNSYLTGSAEKKLLQIYLKIKQAYPGQEVKYGPFPANLNGWVSTGLKFKRGGTFKVEVDKDSKIIVPDEKDNTKPFVLSPAGNGRWLWHGLKAKIGIDIQPVFNTGGYVDKDGILELGVPRLWTFIPQDAVGSSGYWKVYVITSDAEQTSASTTATETAPVKNDDPTNATKPTNEKAEKAKKDLEFLKRIAKVEQPSNGSVETVMLGITYLMSEYKLFFSPMSTSNDCSSTIKNYLEYIWSQKGIPSPNHKYEYSGCINPLITDLEYKINNNLIK